MDFALTEEELAIKRVAREFAQKEVAPYVREWDRDCYYPAREIGAKLGKLGLTGGVIAEKYGGAEMDFMCLVMAADGASYVDSMTGNLITHISCSLGQGTLTYGSEHLKQKYIAPTARGERFGATGVTEPHSGTDIVRRMETMVTKDGDDYIINGTKMWVSNLAWADWMITFGTIDKSLGHRGLCAFILETDWPGITLRPFKNLMGYRNMSTGEVVLDNVRVTKEHLVGEEREGFKVLMTGTEIGRLACAARALGQIEACIDYSVKYAQERVVFDQPIGRYQLVQSKICDMVVGYEAAKLLTYKLAWLKDQGVERCQKEASIAKLYATEVLMKSATDAVQIHGAYGVSDEYPVGKIFRDAKVSQIIDGASEINVVIVGEWALGYRGTPRPS